MPDISAHLFAHPKAHFSLFAKGESSAISIEQREPNIDLWKAAESAATLVAYGTGKELCIYVTPHHVDHDYPLSRNRFFVIGRQTLVSFAENRDQQIERSSVPVNTQTIPPVLHANWGELARSGLSDSAFERLRTLAGKSDGWRGENSKGFVASSLKGLLSFWREVKGVAREPEIMLTPSGTVQAEWHRNHRQFLDIEFRASGDVNFGLFDRGRSLEGTMSMEDAKAAIASYRNGVAFNWAS